MLDHFEDKAAMDEFHEKAEVGIEKYFAGKWTEAIDLLENCSPPWGGDCPATTVVEHMKSLDATPPGNWKGYRLQ